MSVTPKNVNSNTWVRGLNSLRFILALTVLLYHFKNPWVEELKSQNVQLLKISGYLLNISFSGVGAVMAFFIISGFVIHYPNKSGIDNVKKFLVRRWLRIGIPLIVIAAIGISINHFDFIPIWSLYCELIYYTIYPAIARIKISWQWKFGISLFISTILILILASPDVKSLIFHKNINYSGAYWQLGTLLTWIIGLPCWLLGVLLADTIDSITTTVNVRKIYLWRIGMLAIGAFLTADKFHLYISYILSMNLFAIALYYWIKFEILYYRKKTPSATLEYAGEFSYSIYLCHNFGFFLLSFFIPLTNYTYLLYVALTLTLAFIFYLLVEKPSHKIAKYIGARIN